MNIQSVTFKVKDGIKANEIYFDDFNYIQLQSNTSLGSIIGHDIASNNNRYIIRSSIKKESKSVGDTYNSFILSAIKSFSYGYKLVIRPDDIWMAILNVFSIYLNRNSEFKHILVDCEQGIKVTSKDDIFKSPADKLINDIVCQIKKSIVNDSIADWLVPHFSTTNDTDRIVYSTALSSYLRGCNSNHSNTNGCGLSQVTLLGSVQDWLDIKKRFNKISKYDYGTSEMIQWSSLLNPVLDKFIETSNDNIDRDWWNSIVSKDVKSGTDYITGWITCFNIYSNEGKCFLGQKSSKSSGDNQGFGWLEIKYSDIVQGYSSIPIKFVNDNDTFQSELYCGHLAVQVLNQDTIKPSLDWCLIVDSQKIDGLDHSVQQSSNSLPDSKISNSSTNSNKITHRINRNNNNNNNKNNNINNNLNNNNNNRNRNNKITLIILIIVYIIIVGTTFYYKYNYS